MPRFQVDDTFHSHPKALSASLAALGLWTAAGSWSSGHHTDGVLPDHVVRSLSRGESGPADELVAAGLWKRTRGGYRFHQWDADGDGTPRNLTAIEAKAAKANQSSGGIIGNHRRWHVKTGRRDPKCRYCLQEPPSGTRSEPDQSPDIGTDSHPNPPSPCPVPTEQEQDPPASRAPRSGQTKGSRIPADFAATPEMIAWARQNTPLVGQSETDQFRDYWLAEAGAKASKRDWIRAWQVWMRREQKSAERRRGNQRPNSDDTIRDLLGQTGTEGATILQLTRGEP